MQRGKLSRLELNRRGGAQAQLDHIVGQQSHAFDAGVDPSRRLQVRHSCADAGNAEPDIAERDRLAGQNLPTAHVVLAQLGRDITLEPDASADQRAAAGAAFAHLA
ncbi:hypothetical protein FQZ97_790290 [compost metagenome]